MTEIPEHLLKRSKERRAAIGGEDAPASEEATAPPAAAGDADAPSTAPAVPVAAAVEPAPPPPPKPVRPEVAAALKRSKIPIWALPVLAALPLWAYVYQATLEPAPTGEETPFVLGEAVYGGCASCHGAGGGGGAGPALDGVLQTWPDYRDHMMWVKLGDAGWPGTTYGANGTVKAVGMPAHASLTDAELAQVVLYERTAFGGLDPTSEEYLALVEIAEGRMTFAEAGLGDLSLAAGVEPADLEAG